MFRPVTPDEIAALEANGCSAEDWGRVLVKPGFDPSRVRDAAFSGTCRLGVFSAFFDLPGGVRKPSGIYRAVLHEVSVGDDARLHDIRSHIANYDVGEGAHVAGLIAPHRRVSALLNDIESGAVAVPPAPVLPSRRRASSIARP